MNLLLFALTVMIWGSSWIAIAMQVGPVPVLVSVFYRFGLAALIYLALLAAMGRLRLPSRRDQIWIAAQALCLFSLNFLCFYSAASYIPSGLMSVVFSLASIFNALNARLFFGDAISRRTVLAVALGAGGLALLFGGDLAHAEAADTLRGLALAAMGTMFFSLGNMVSRRNSAAGLPPSIASAWGMGYGALVLLGLIALTGTPVVLPPDARYMGALLYLSLLGSVVGFTTYLLLVARIGSSRAAYTTVLFPIIALTISTIFEGYVWHWTGLVGLALALMGNVVMFARPLRLSRAERAARH